ncbi:MAG: orotidine-5'-phosphate decarboxylase [Bacillota bacterium]|nr:orotidine-5'-phosphate decarboxylase [Bacillota bacterium]
MELQKSGTAIDRLYAAIKEKGNPSAAGLDTWLEYVPEGSKADTFARASKLILEYNKRLIDALYDIIPAVKVQAACYEMYGHEGMKAFAETLEYAKSRGLITIADVKRGDTGDTSQAYARAYLGKTALGESEKAAFDVDFATVNAYLGSDGVQPFIDQCREHKKGIFILVKTSNLSSGQLQDLFANGKPLYETMGEYVMQWGSGIMGRCGYSSIGAVVGATYPAQGEALRKKLKGVFFLVPGYGMQGGKGSDIAGCFDDNGMGAIVNASRSILLAYRNPDNRGMDPESAARKEALRMREDISEALKNAGKYRF